MNQRRWTRHFSPLLIATLLALTSCENGNLFGKLHKSGDSGDSKTLNSDASVALSNKNYDQALELYERVLAGDPRNSVALKGAAAAQIGRSLDFGVLIANILNKSGAPSSSSVMGLGDFIARSRSRVSAQDAPSGSLLAGINLEELNNDIDPAICRLQTIVSGAGDGVIKSDDPSVMINLGILCLIRAVLRPLRAGYIDVENDGNSFNVVVLKDLTALCVAPDSSILNQVGADVAAGYFMLDRAVTKLGLDSDRTITKLRDDIGTVGTKLLTPAENILPQACIDTLNQPPANINLSNFEGKSDILTPPASPC